MPRQTTLQRAQDAKTLNPTWRHVDADGEVLGRLAASVALVLMGKHRPEYTPHVLTGEAVVVTNAEKVVLTGKKEEQKTYMSFSGFVSGHRTRTVPQLRAKRPEFLLEHAVKGMLPKNRLADKMLTKLRIFAGPAHDHVAQNPEKIAL